MFLYTFGVRRTTDVLDSENQPGSGEIRTRSGSIALVQEGFKNYLKYSSNKLLKISLRLRYKAPDPVFGQNRILIPNMC